MNRTQRILVATSLVTTALLSTVFVLLEPEFPSGYADRLDAIADAGAPGAISGLGFVVSQLPFMVAVVGVACWLARSSRKLAVIGGSLALLGGFGHAVYGGVMLSQMVMADDAANRDAYATLLESLESSPLLIPFMAAGLLGTVLGLILLGVAHFRSRREPRWIGPALWAFVLVEFVGSNLSEWATYLSGLLYLAAFGMLALSIARDGGDVIADAPTPAGHQS